MFNFALIDPLEGLAQNPKGILGIDIPARLNHLCTLGNICPGQPEGYQGLPALDPMWYRNDPGRDDAGSWLFSSAIQLATTCKLPPDGATIAATQADQNSLGAMAVLALRLQGFGPAMVDRSSQCYCPVCGKLIEDAGLVVGNSDYYDCRNPLCRWREDTGLLNGPVTRRIWAVGKGDAFTETEIAQAISDSSTPLEQRVRLMKYWLLTSDEPLS